VTQPAESAGPIVPARRAGPAPAMAIPHDESVRQAQLDTMKRRATLLLLGATVLFVITRTFESRYPWLGFIRATMEAAMVGGLADWFAVTALFRHPLGIPIPHTAIVPSRKDRVGRTLGAFVQRNFLTREVIEFRLRSLQVGRRLAEWLADPANARTISRNVAVALSSAAEMLRDEDVQEMLDRSLAKRVRTMHLAPLIGKVLNVMTEDDELSADLSEPVRAGVGEAVRMVESLVEELKAEEARKEQKGGIMADDLRQLTP